MKNIKYILFVLFIIITFVSGCVTTSSPTSAVGGGNAGTITIISPVTNDSIGFGTTPINYSVIPVGSNQSVELYIDGIYNSTYFTNVSNSQPLAIVFDSLKIGTRFRYFLKYYGANGSFAFSDTMRNILITPPRIKPYQPFNLNLNVISNTEVNISWVDSSIGITSYELEKKVGNAGTWNNIFGPLPQGTFNINDRTVNLALDIYYYRIRGKNNFGYSDYSDVVNTSGGGSTGSLAQPRLISSVQTNLPTAPSEVTLIWTISDPNVNYFNVERSTNFSPQPVFIKTFIKNSVFTYKDNSVLLLGITYNYDIKAYSNTDSSWSNTISVLIK